MTSSGRVKKRLSVVHAFSLVLLSILFACHPSSRLNRSFDQIRVLVLGKSASEIEKILGPPDSRQSLLLGDERWIWWNYTFLGGQDYSPDVRGRIVHLQITFANPNPTSKIRQPYSLWRIEDPLSVSYLLPAAEP